MNIGINNYSNNNFLTAMNVPVIAEEIFGALPPADQINLSSTCKDARLSLQSIMNIRLSGIFGSPNIFNKLSTITKTQSGSINQNARDTLKRFIRRVSLDYGMKKPQYDIAKIIDWFKSIDLLEGDLADYLTWKDLQVLGLFSHEDWVVAAHSAAKELAHVSSQLLQTIASAEEASGVALAGFSAFKAEFAEMLRVDQRLVEQQHTLSTAELMDIALDIQAEASAVQLATRTVEPDTVPVEEKVIKAIETMQALPMQEHDIFALGPNSIHQKILEENLINILSFGKKINLINYLGINLSENIDEEGNSILSLENYTYELDKLIKLISNEEMPFPVGIIGLFLLEYLKGEIEKGNENAQKCLQKIKYPNVQDKKGNTLLHWAANAKKWKIASILLNVGASPDIQDADKKTPLHWAAAFAPEEDLSLFLEKSTNLNVRDENKCTALHWAVDASNWKNVTLLLKAGANPSLLDDIGRTPLHWVAQAEENAIVQLLLEKGANVSRKDKIGNTALHYALNRQNMKSAKLLLKGHAPIDVKNKMRDTPLHLLVKAHNVELVKIALENGKYKNLDALNKIGESALDIALLSDNKKIGLLLLRKGAKPNKYADKLFYRLLAWRLQALIFKIPSINA